MPIKNKDVAGGLARNDEPHRFQANRDTMNGELQEQRLGDAGGREVTST
jgi:hypothetical protein